MKSTWDIVAFVAVVNLVAILAIAGWLVASDRVNADRLESVRALFAEPLDVVAEREEQEELAALEIARLEAVEESLSDLPVSSGVPIDAAEKNARHEKVILRRVQGENERDRRILEEHERRLKAKERELEARVAAFVASTEAQKVAQQDQRFLDTVKLLQDLPPRQGKEFILVRVQDGKIDQTVAWLRAMRAGARKDIFEAMKSEEELALASVLLDRLSGSSIPAKPVVETSDANGANASAPD